MAGNDQGSWSSWMTRTTMVGAVGVCTAVFLWGPSRLVAVGVPMLLVAACGHLMFSDGTREQGGVFAGLRSILRVTAFLTTVLMCLGVAAALSPALGVLIALALAVASPPVRKLFRPRAQPGSSVGWAGGSVECSRMGATGLRALSEAELSRAWRRSSRDLAATRETSRRLALVITRQHLLDEVWTRNRIALDSWVACGARAGDGTPRYVDPP